MTFTSSLALFVSMIVLALIPGPGILAVAARSATAGFRHGASTTLGIVAGDFVFISLALLGLAALSQTFGGLFSIVKYLGAAYLLWLGMSMILAKEANANTASVKTYSHFGSFSAGLVTTLSNPKAILFYLSFLPAFLDFSQVSVVDVVALYVIATIAVGGVMLGYAYVAHRARAFYQNPKQNQYLRYGSGSMLVTSGIYVASRG